jgi:hypothetical protein
MLEVIGSNQTTILLQNGIICGRIKFYTLFVERYVGYSQCKEKMMSFMGQASWENMMSPGASKHNWGATQPKKYTKLSS